MLYFRTLFRIILFILLPLTIFSCSDFFLPYFEVKDFSYDHEKIIIDFSSEINGDKTRRAFSLMSEGNKINGTHKTQGKTFFFYPENGIKENKEYEITVNTLAEDINGNSLKEKFNRRISTKVESIKPYIVKITPADNCTLVEKAQTIQVLFSKPIKESSFYSAFTIEPSIDYIVDFEETLTKATIVPLKDFERNKNYKITINTQLQDNFENNLSENFISHFTFGNDNTPPSMQSSYKDKSGREIFLLKSPDENHGIPVDGNIILKFDEEVKIDYVGTKIEVHPSSIKYTLEEDKVEKNKVSIKLQGKFNESCWILVNKGIEDLSGNKTDLDEKYILNFDNESNRPVSFCKAFLKTDGNSSYKELSYSTQFTDINLDPVYFANDRISKITELFIIFQVSAESNGIEFFSAIDALSFKTTNSCCSMLIHKAEFVTKENFEKLNICQLSSTESFSIIKFTIGITNTNKNGLWEFNIDSNVKDSLGNTLGENISLTFNK